MAILLVDDSRVARLHVQKVLNGGGHVDVVSVDSPSAAFAYLGMPGDGDGLVTPAVQTLPPSAIPSVDLVLLDGVLPEMDGVEVCRRIKATEYLRDVPVIMLTGASETEYLAAAFAAGAMDFIIKTSNEVELLARVRSALQLKHEIDIRRAHEQEVNVQLQRALAAEKALAVANARLTEQASELANELEQRQQAEAALRESEARYRAVVEHSAEGIAIYVQGTLSFANHAFAALHGLMDARSALGTALEALAVPEERAQLRAAHIQVVTNPSAEHAAAVYEYSIQRPDGELRTVEASIVRITYDGRPAALMVTRDISERRAVEQLKEEYMVMVTHELRTPLSTIQGFADLLVEGDLGTLPPLHTEYLGIIQANTRQLVAIVSDLLDLARIESNRFQLDSGPLDVGGVVRGVLASLRPQIEGKGQTLALALHDPLPAVWGDPDRVAQILTNLISNAHKYTPAGGSIVVGAVPHGNNVRVTVRDTGIGLSPEEQANLFTKFFRATSSVVREQAGTGLGLVITRSLVELHGGTLSVQSAPGQGSTFGFTLPLAAARLNRPLAGLSPLAAGDRV